MTTCQRCDQPAVDDCRRCERPTCSEHHYDELYLGVCQPCMDEIQSDPRPMYVWPFPVRRINPAWFPPGSDPREFAIEVRPRPGDPAAD